MTFIEGSELASVQSVHCCGLQGSAANVQAQTGSAASSSTRPTTAASSCPRKASRPFKTRQSQGRWSRTSWCQSATRPRKGDEVVVALATARNKLRAMREAQDADRKARRAAVGDVVKGKPEAQPAKRHRKAGANPAKPAKRPGFDRPKGRSRKSQKADGRTSCSQLVPKPQRLSHGL